MPERTPEAAPRIVLTCAEGSVEIVPVSKNRFRVTLNPTDRNAFIPLRSCESSLPIEIISDFLGQSFTSLCDCLARHDDPDYVINAVRTQLLAYFDPSSFERKRILDFGCGTGASTVCMAAMLPQTEVIGVELDPDNIRIARKVAAARGTLNCKFLLSPDANSIPPGIGPFDFVMLSAVYEHLLPEERLRLLPLIWSSLNHNGALFVNQTPHRYFPYEHHTTGLWFINYLPDRIALIFARNFSKYYRETNATRDWNEFLRCGIRGGTEAEITRNLRRSNGAKPVVLQPKEGDRAAYWLSLTNPKRHRAVKRVIAAFFRVTDKVFGTIPSMNLDLVIRKG